MFIAGDIGERLDEQESLKATLGYLAKVGVPEDSFVGAQPVSRRGGLAYIMFSDRRSGSKNQSFECQHFLHAARQGMARCRKHVGVDAKPTLAQNHSVATRVRRMERTEQDCDS